MEAVAVSDVVRELIDECCVDVTGCVEFEVNVSRLSVFVPVKVVLTPVEVKAVMS